MRHLHAYAVVVLASLVAPTVHAQQGWRGYTNDRYGTMAAVPPGFVMQPPPGSDDGRTFIAPDGAVLRIFAAGNAFDDTPAAYIDRQIAYGDFDTVSLRRATKTWAVVSGVKGSKIVYEKFLFKDDFVHHMTIEYPAASRAAYDAIVTRLAASLRAP